MNCGVFVISSLIVSIPIGECPKLNVKITCPQPISVKEGSDLILLYEIHPPRNVSMESVEWTRNSKIVYSRRNGIEDPDDKDPAFQNRTDIFCGNGNFSLNISNVTKEDEGIYFVEYRETLSKCNVTVTIEKKENEERTGGSEKKEDEESPGHTDNNDFPWWGWLLLAIGVMFIGCILVRLRRASGKGPDEQHRRDADDPGTIPLQDLGAPAPQNDDINGEREPLQQDNTENGQPQED